MARKGYNQTIRLKDSEGASATILMHETKSKLLNLELWRHPEADMDAIVHTLIVAATLMTDNPTLRAKLNAACDMSLNLVLGKGLTTFIEGQVIPADDLPF